MIAISGGKKIPRYIEKFWHNALIGPSDGQTDGRRYVHYYRVLCGFACGRAIEIEWPAMVQPVYDRWHCCSTATANTLSLVSITTRLWFAVTYDTIEICFDWLTVRIPTLFLVVSVALLVARRTNNRKVCITVWQVTAWGNSFFRAVRSWSLRPSAFDELGSGMGKW